MMKNPILLLYLLQYQTLLMYNSSLLETTIADRPNTGGGIIGGLCRWYRGKNLQLVWGHPAFLQQCSLGWKTFLEGGLSVLWQKEVLAMSENSKVKQALDGGPN